MFLSDYIENPIKDVVKQKVPGSVFATRESLLEARTSFGGGEVKPERPRGGTGWDREWSRGADGGTQDNNNHSRKGRSLQFA